MKKLFIILVVLDYLVGLAQAQTATEATSSALASNQAPNPSTGVQTDEQAAGPQVWRKIFQTTDKQGKIIYETQAVTTVPPVHIPNLRPVQKSPMDGFLTWDGMDKETNVAAITTMANFVFNFTNVSSDKLVILRVQPSCGCTTVKLPALPWVILPGEHSNFTTTVNFSGKTGTLFKTIGVSTDKGSKTLLLKINILPMSSVEQSVTARDHGLMMAKADRQAVFHDDCASCHRQRGEDKYGKFLYAADCGICHEGPNRATMVPNLHALKAPASEKFWRDWITHGRPGSLMPAFSLSEGGPLTDRQITSLVDYLNEVISPPVSTLR